MSLTLNLSVAGRLTATLPGPSGSSKTIELPFSRDTSGTLGGQPADLTINAASMLKLIGWLESQTRAGDLRPWLDETKPEPTVSKLAARGKARTPVDPLSPARRRELGLDRPLEILTLTELIGEDF